MIAPLRRWHRRIWIVLAILLPVLVWMALAARQEVPPMERIPLASGEAP